MSEDARQSVVADLLLVEHVKYSVSFIGQSVSGSEAQYLYPVCAICARRRHRELISLTSHTSNVSPSTNSLADCTLDGRSGSSYCMTVRTRRTPMEERTIVMSYVPLTHAQHMYRHMRLTQGVVEEFTYDGY